MTETQAVEAMFEAFDAGWKVQQPAVPYTFENESFTTVETFARVTVRHTTGQQGSLGPPGSRRFERRGNIMVQLFGAIDVGRKPIAALADSVRAILESTSMTSGGESVVTFGARTQEVPTDGTFAMVVVIVPFLYFAQR